MATTHLLVTTNGRDEFLDATLRRNLKLLHGLDGLRLIVDDTGTPEHGDRTCHEYMDLDFTVIQPDHSARRGQAKAIDTAWRYLRHHADPHDYVFHLEDDFLLMRDIEIAELRDVLNAHVFRAQVVLMRQPWFANEIACGGVIPAREAQGATFHTREDCVTHQDHWSFNPCLYPLDLTADYDYPQTDWAEANFGRMLAADGYHFAYYGTAADWPMVEHIGRYRAEGGRY